MADFIHSSEPQVHFARRKAMLKEHPNLKELRGPNRWTPLIIVFLVSGQLALAWVATQMPIWAAIVMAYIVGGVFAHALYVMIHEATHNLAARSITTNRLLGIACDFALVFPGAMPFRKYHLLHHRFMGEPDLDADMASVAEARFIGNSWWRKALWMLFFGISQGLRPSKIEGVEMLDRWTVAGFVLVFAVDGLILYLLGPIALLYLALSMLFGLGLHPLGGRWIQEHYVTTPGQETYSYYGPGNKLAFNVGYHNEHHDLMNVPWNRLPEIRRRAPEFYDNLASYRSWGALLLKFIFDPSLSPFSRITHPSTRKGA